jgi:hypothetical protein
MKFLRRGGIKTRGGDHTMSGAYPHFKPSYTHEELVEHFLLTPAELQLVLTCRGDANRCGMALLLKALAYLGYVPEKLDCMPSEVRSFIAGQLGLLWDFCERYPWDSRTRDQYLFLIRQHTGWRFPTAQDKEELEHWLRREAALQALSADRLLDYACQRLRDRQIELPAEGELQRVVNTALSGFFQDMNRRIAAAIPLDVRSHIDKLLIVSESGGVSAFENLKADPGRPGIDNLQSEIAKLRAIRAIALRAEPFAEVPWKLLQMFKRRATNEMPPARRGIGLFHGLFLSALGSGAPRCFWAYFWEQ